MKSEVMRTSQIPATVLSFDNVFSYPQYTLRGIKSWQEVASLGSKNIATLISRARDNEKSFMNRIASLKQQAELLRGKSGEDFKRMATDFQNPTITQIGVPSDSWSKDPEPLDTASKNREHDTTTFNMCGWCKHAGGGSCRYSYHITTSCSLLGKSPKTRFNTPCLLQGMSTPDFAREVERLERETEEALAKREKVRQGIKLLQDLKRGATEKPYLMSLRPHDHFNVGDDVMVYVGQWGGSEHKSTVKDGVWVPAIVVFGYRHHDGCVSYEALFPIHSNVSYSEGRGGGAGMSRPEALLRSEFNYLQEAAQNKESSDFGFVGLWLANVDDDLGGFDKAQFLKDLFSGKVATPPVDWQPPTDEIEVKTVKDAERVLQMFDASLFKTEKEIRDWAAMQLRQVHPDCLHNTNDNVKAYAARQTRAVYAARNLLIARLGTRQR